MLARAVMPGVVMLLLWHFDGKGRGIHHLCYRSTCILFSERTGREALIVVNPRIGEGTSSNLHYTPFLAAMCYAGRIVGHAHTLLVAIRDIEAQEVHAVPTVAGAVVSSRSCSS